MSTDVPKATINSAQGGDTSDYQPVCAYRGYDFGYPKATEGTGFIAHTFAGSFANLKGRPRGAYHFYHPSLNATDQARFFWSVVKAQNPQPGDFLVADIEIMVGADGSWEASPSAARRMNQPELHFAAAPPAHAGVLTNGSRVFLDELSSLAGPHHPVLVYTNLNVGAQLTSCTGYGLIIAYPSHLAPKSVFPWKTWLMWQWGAGGGPCGGDSDAFNGTKADLQAWQDKYKPHDPPPPPPPPSPKPKLRSKSGDDMIYLPNGKGAQAAFPVPASVPQADGTAKPPKVVRLTSTGVCSVSVRQGGGPSSNWSDPATINFNRSPNEITLVSPLPPSVKFERDDDSNVLVVVDFA